MRAASSWEWPADGDGGRMKNAAVDGRREESGLRGTACRITEGVMVVFL